MCGKGLGMRLACWLHRSLGTWLHISISLLFRLMFEVSSRHAMAYVDHNNGTKVVEASTTELCISRYLYKTSDVAAAYNIGRVIASRCKETGLYRVMWQHKRDRSHKKVGSFFMWCHHLWQCKMENSHNVSVQGDRSFYGQSWKMERYTFNTFSMHWIRQDTTATKLKNTCIRLSKNFCSTKCWSLMPTSGLVAK